MPFSPSRILVGHEKQNKAATIQGLLHERGWEEVGFLGSGARGPVLLVRQQGRDTGRIRHSALKRSVHEEVRALRALAQCRNVVRLEEHFTNPDINEVWVRLEWLEGGNLRNFLRGLRPSKPSEDAACFLLGEVLEGLQEIHRQGWMHRDVKAENIGLSKPDVLSDGRFECSVKLLDFDTATPVPGSGSKLTEVIGTVENMAPEVYAGSYDEKADLWSFGIVLFEVLFGYRPFNDPCIDTIEEMVKNWQRYLVIPSDASEAATSFLRHLLTGAKDRLSASQAVRHPWQRGAKDSMNAALAASALSDVLEKEKDSKSAAVFSSRIGGLCSGTSLAPLKSPDRPLRSPDRRGSLPSYLPQKSSSPIGSPTPKAMRRASDVSYSSKVIDGDEEVESLSRIRRSLAEWNQNMHPCGILRFSGGSLSASRFDTSSLADNSRFSFAEVDTSSVAYSSRAGGLRNSSSSPLNYCPDDVTEEVDPGPPSTDCDFDYLRRVRAKTQEVVLAAARASADIYSNGLSNHRSPNRSRTSVTEFRQIPDDSVTREVDNTERVCDRNDRWASASSMERYEEPTSCESPLAHLKGAQQKMKDLLVRLSTANIEATNVRATRSQSPPSSQTPLTRGSRLAPLARSPDSVQPESEPTPSPKEATEFGSSSPEAWLAQHRRRTETLLGRLRLASEGMGERSVPVWV